MEHIADFIGKGLLYLLVALAVALATMGLQALARRYGGARGERLLKLVFAAMIGVTLGNTLPSLYPALAPWSTLVLGASIGFVFTAMQPGIPTRRDAVRLDTPRSTP